MSEKDGEWRQGEREREERGNPRNACALFSSVNRDRFVREFNVESVGTRRKNKTYIHFEIYYEKNELFFLKERRRRLVNRVKTVYKNQNEK